MPPSAGGYVPPPERLERGVSALLSFAATLSEEQWKVRVPKDGRTVGVIVHHVASVFPIEIQLAQTLASGKDITGVVWDTVHDMNAGHARDHADVTKAEALELLRCNSEVAAAAIRALSNEELNRAARVSFRGRTWRRPGRRV